jgi:TRAP-type C4-dicarboxylate transport system permease small subunit
MAEPGNEDPYEGRFGIIRRIDDWIFHIEMGILWTFLGVSAIMVFLDVMYRRLAAPDSKVAELTARIFGVESPEAVERLTALGPKASAVIGVGLVYFAFWTAERHAAEPGKQSRIKPVIETVFACVGLGLLGWIMIRPDVESRWFYLLLYSLSAGFWLVNLLRERAQGWASKLVAFFVVTAIYVYITLNHFPDGYSWSKELSLIMLLWVGFLGASVCAHEGKHIQVGALKRVVPPSMARWMDALGFLFTAAFCFFMAMLGYEYAKEALMLEGRFEQTNIPDWVATIAVPAAFAMTSLRYIAAAFSSILGGSYGAAPEDESIAAATAEASKEGAEG